MELPLPDNLEAAARWLLGGVLIFAFGFESVVMLWEGKFLFAAGSFLIAVGLTLLLVYWAYLPTIVIVAAAVLGIASIPFVFRGTVHFVRQRQISKPMLMVAGIFFLAAAVIALIAAGAIFYVAKTTNPDSAREQIADLKSDLDTVTRQRDEAIRDLKKAAEKPDLTPRVAQLEAQLEATTEALRAERTKPDSAARVAELQAQLEAKTREVQARSVPITGAPIGPMTTLQMRQRLGARFRAGGVLTPTPPGFNPIEIQWAVVFTAPNTNQEFVDFLYRVMIDAGLQIQRLEPPDREKNLDAPDFSSAASRRAGVTLHGDDVLSKRLSDALTPCVTTAITSKTVDGLRDWYLKIGRIGPEQQVVWIEIGEGIPWTMDRRCWT